MPYIVYGRLENDSFHIPRHFLFLSGSWDLGGRIWGMNFTKLLCYLLGHEAELYEGNKELRWWCPRCKMTEVWRAPSLMTNFKFTKAAQKRLFDWIYK